MNKNSENKIIVISCIFTAIVVVIFTLSQGEIRFGKKDTYKINAESKSEPYSVVMTVEDGGTYTVLAYQNKKLTDNEIIDLVKEVKKENKDLDTNYNIKIYNSEDNVSLKGENNKNLKIVVRPASEGKISISKYYSEIENEAIEVPIYTQLSSENIEDEDNANETLKTKIEISMESDDIPENNLSKIKAVGNYTRSVMSTFEILNIVSYTSDEKDEYWEYNGHYKNDIMHGRIIDLEN